MDTVRIPWSPRVLLTGRTVRLPVQAASEEIDLEAGAFRVIASRWSPRDSTRYYYLQAPEERGDYTVRASWKGRSTEATIRVRGLDDLRQLHEYNGAWWPRRWPSGQPYRSTKRRQTLQDFPHPTSIDEGLVRWWTSQTDAVIWSQLPPAELPKAHFVNVHQGCPTCGTAVFQFGGFYPWKRNHLPCDFRSECPSCGARFPSNDLMRGDFISGECVDDGFGYFDREGHLFLFAATYHRDQARAYWSGISTLTGWLRTEGFDETIARQLGLMLLRSAVEEIYIASAPQFRYGPSKSVEEPWDWGQTDWASEPDPVAALTAKGTVHYCIDIPYVSEVMAFAYDTIWPLLRDDHELVTRAQALGLGVQRPEDVIVLIEEMLAVLLQCILDRGARSNLPRESQGALVLLRGLDRPDAQDAMDWLYDAGPDRLRVFATNDFTPDGTPPEATGGYNSIHTNGLFALEYHLRRLRQGHPDAYPESRFPSLVADPKTPHIARQPHEITMIGKSYFQFGDGSSPGCRDQWTASQKAGSLVLDEDLYHAPMDPQTLAWAAEFTGDPVVKEILTAVRSRQHRRIGTTILDSGGIAILRTAEVPERAAVGIVYGDTTSHRHMDLLDVQVFAFQRPFLTDLGYPQSWATLRKWEGHWATHNTVWGVLPGVPGHGIAGRGRLVHTLFTEGLQVLDIQADRWVWDDERKRWYKPGVTFRRLIALVETDGQGVAVVDLSRVRGGTEHWRVCRGLEGSFLAENFHVVPRSGTVADPEGRRGDVEGLSHPDYDGLACMDDVASGEAVQGGKGTWQSRHEPAVHLDLHQVRVSPSTELLTARATAVMGTPEISSYAYRTMLWRRHPAGVNEATCVDLVFEPRIGEAALAQTRAISAGVPTAGGVELVTRQGKRLTIYWAPDAGPEELTEFSDGTTLHGALAAMLDGRVVASGAAALRWQDRAWPLSPAQRGRIVALDRHACTIDVERLAQITPGDRVRINPDGRGHHYGVEAVEVVSDGRLRLKLDVTSVLGRAPVVSVEQEQVELGMPIMTRTGNLHHTRLLVEADDAWAEIVDATNQKPGQTIIAATQRPDQTIVWVDGRKGDVERVKRLAPGAWVSIVDYVAGDVVLFEPCTIRESR